MNKTGKYAINGAIICGLGNAFINALKQINKINENPNEIFDWKELLVATGKGAVVGGVGGGIIGAISDYQNSLEKPLNTDFLLLGLVDNARLSKEDKTYKSLNEKADQLVTLLKKEFGAKFSGDPMKLGSTEKGTAIRDKFDIDICLPFKPGSFSSTEVMFNSVLNFLEQHVSTNSIVNIRDQKKSVGLILELRENKFKIDVVPYKLTSGNCTSGYLYVNDRNYFQNNSTYTKTDIHALKSQRLTETQKKIVVALKIWKTNYDVPASSFLLENLVLDAYNYNRNHIPKKFTQKLLMVFSHIEENLKSTVIRSIENTNNVLTNISDSEKNSIVSSCRRVIEEYKYQPNSIIKYLSYE